MGESSMESRGEEGNFSLNLEFIDDTKEQLAKKNKVNMVAIRNWDANTVTAYFRTFLEKDTAGDHLQILAQARSEGAAGDVAGGASLIYQNNK